MKINVVSKYCNKIAVDCTRGTLEQIKIRHVHDQTYPGRLIGKIACNTRWFNFFVVTEKKKLKLRCTIITNRCVDRENRPKKTLAELPTATAPARCMMLDPVVSHNDTSNPACHSGASAPSSIEF